LDWTDVAKTVGSTTVALAVVGYFLRGVFGQVLSRDLEKFKAGLSKEHDIEIERLRNGLRIAASEHETRFTRLHEARAEAIAELYKRLVRAQGAFDLYLNTVAFGADPDPAKEEQAVKGMGELIGYFREKRIYFEEELCRDIDAAIEEHVNVWVRTGAYPIRMPDGPEQWSKAALHFSEHFPPIRAKIERQFRELIGVQKPACNGQRTTDKGLLPQ
jgi:hypothetical protein